MEEPDHSPFTRQTPDLCTNALKQPLMREGGTHGERNDTLTHTHTNTHSPGIQEVFLGF